MFTLKTHSPKGNLPCCEVRLATGFCVFFKSLSHLTSLLGSNKFSPSARQTLGLYGLYQRFTTFHKPNKPTRFAVKLTGAAVHFILTPPRFIL